MLIRDNQKLTLITVSAFLATTCKQEITTTRQVDGRQAYKLRGKKKEYYLKVDAETLVFDGWALPYKVDTDTSSFEGTGGYNFLVTASPTALKMFIISKNINPLFTNWKQINYDLENLRGRFCKPLFNAIELHDLYNLCHPSLYERV